jgi:hypothetical protein
VNSIKVNRYLMPFLVLVTLLGSVWVAKAAGLWQTSGRGQILLDESGQADPQGIKGWMTLGEIADTYGLPLEALYVMIGAGADLPPDTALKDLEKLVPGMEVSAVRAVVAAYRAGTWQPEDGRYGGGDVVEDIPQPAPEPTVSPEPEAIAPEGEAHSPQGPGPGGGSGEGVGPGYALPQDGGPLPGAQIKGRMTVQEVVDLCQVPLEVLIEELGLPEDLDTQLRMRDLANQLGIEVTTVREVVDRYQAEN